jgi:curved DNA-binding protein CbpA
LKDAAKNLDDHIRAVDPDLNAATDKFSRMSKAYDKLSKDALSGKVDTIQRRLGRIFNAGDIERKAADPMAQIGAGQKALDTVLDAKTAQGFHPIINPRLEKAAHTTGGGIAGASGALAAKTIMGGPKALAAGAGVLAATSPRLNQALIRASVVPIGESAAVDALASPTARAAVTSPLLRRLQSKEKK